MALTISNDGAKVISHEPFTVSVTECTLVQDGTATTGVLAVPHAGPDGREPFMVVLNKRSDEGEYVESYNWTVDIVNNEIDLDVTLSAAGTDEDESVFEVVALFLPGAPDAGRGTTSLSGALPNNTNF